MKLSPAMRSMLLLQLKFDGPSRKVALGRPMHRDNLVTHEALLRRGLIQEAGDEFGTTTLTEKGREMARRLSGEPAHATEK